MLSLVAGCGKTDPGPHRVTPSASAPVAADATPVTSGPVGWWRSEHLCFELFDNGDFQLSIMPDDVAPKVQVLGEATVVTQHGNDFVFSLHVTRIWTARYTSRCRKVVRQGHWGDDAEALGVTWKPDARVELRFKRTDETHAEVCAQSCVSLHREQPELHGRWRLAGVENPFKPTVEIHDGDLVEIGFDAERSHIWLGAPSGKLDDGSNIEHIDGVAVVHYDAPDHFTITFTAGNVTRVFTAKRVPGERLTLCEGADRCTTLDRQFSGDHYDLD